MPGLLFSGCVSIDGHACPVELPRASSDSSAAAGKRPAISLDKLIQQYPVVLGSILIPGASDSSNVADEESGSSTNAVPRCYVCKETSDYRRVASMVVRPHDVVLEIGSDLGLTCAIAWPLCGGKLVGVDLSETSRDGEQAYPNIQFEVLDACRPTPPPICARSCQRLMTHQRRRTTTHKVALALWRVDDGVVKQREESVVRSDFTPYSSSTSTATAPAVLSVLQLVLQNLGRASFASEPRLACNAVREAGAGERHLRTASSRAGS